MSGLLVCVLMAALVGVGLTSPVSKSDGNTKQGGILSQLLARREAVRRTSKSCRPSQVRGGVESSECVFVLFAEMMNECPGRDYQGWVDFGRRTAE
uniref:Gastrin/cholecystokinin peptide hormone domain-containing protein n=1 Tax=Salmo trutta TaxID=8032 RepID=A0A673ZFZ6_SALTR